MRVLVVSNMKADAGHPERGSFVRDQVEALRELPDLDVELYEFPPGGRGLTGAARDLHERYRGERLDVVHSHFGLSAWPALGVRARARALTVHGTDLSHPRTRILTRAVLPKMDLLAAVSESLVQQIPGKHNRKRTVVLPCGVNMERFKLMPRAQARETLKLEADGRYVLFAADPARPEKRYDRAKALAQAVEATLLTLGGVEPSRVPLFINASSAVVVPSAREGFGLAVVEALACDVPVLGTPVGVHREALEGVAGTLCAEFDLARWTNALAPILADPDPRVAGRTRAELFSATRMAERVADAYRSLVADAG
jgi:glycosyltransferase involved in cell wall biosynthesis